MGDAPAEDRFDRAWVQAAADQVVESTSAALASAIGAPVALTLGDLEDVAAPDVARVDDPVIVVLCRCPGPPAVAIQLVVPRPFAAALSGLALGEDLESLEAAGKEPLDSEHLGALREAMSAFVEPIERAVGEHLEGALALQDALEVEEPASDPTWLIGERFQRVQFVSQVEGSVEGVIAVLFPPDPEAVSVGDLSGRRIGLLREEPDGEEVEALSRAMGCPVDCIALEPLMSEPAETLAGIDALLIPWEVAGRAGIDLVERLTREAPELRTGLLLSHPEPTGPMVRAALTAGARSFVMEPLDPAEIVQRVGLASDESSTVEPSDEPASAEESDESCAAAPADES